MAFGDGANGVKSAPFLAINPNGRIPALTHQPSGTHVFETSAILEYLAEVYDTERRLSFDPKTHRKEWAEERSWIYFAHGGVGPMFGQAGVFLRMEEKMCVSPMSFLLLATES